MSRHDSGADTSRRFTENSFLLLACDSNLPTHPPLPDPLLFSAAPPPSPLRSQLLPCGSPPLFSTVHLVLNWQSCSCPHPALRIPSIPMARDQVQSSRWVRWVDRSGRFAAGDAQSSNRGKPVSY